ncbi:MAG TPA: DUF2892 domain-containing protein [Anaerolineaceae bacterium]|jgi:hypothetical protein|nr:DUF2892 domain-containing protein [Anaerolineaceae bacterium]HNZ01180.1 DUF2892 domain-containing protein [Anaerolineaceae bacterium]HOU44671.1 DUF2892 domain-containing protein [Anaerolineaceae bacterium]HPA32936.1 DUF2892 domain-containing protein [Anaerolineaceae bacterium]HQF45869.1 DUF2892 domain-containing protein [Anaerolineaceae bacterium]
MKINESMTDRIVRVVLGIVLLVLGWGGIVTGTLGVIFKWLGFIPLITGIVGFCPLYALFKIRTNRA